MNTLKKCNVFYPAKFELPKPAKMLVTETPVLACRCGPLGMGWAVCGAVAGPRVVRMASGYFHPHHESLCAEERTHVAERVASLIIDFKVRTIVYPAGVPTSHAAALPMMFAAAGRIASAAIDLSDWRGSLHEGYSMRLCRRLLGYECASPAEADALGMAAVFLLRRANLQMGKVA